MQQYTSYIATSFLTNFVAVGCFIHPYMYMHDICILVYYYYYYEASCTVYRHYVGCFVVAIYNYYIHHMQLQYSVCNSQCACIKHHLRGIPLCIPYRAFLVCGYGCMFDWIENRVHLPPQQLILLARYVWCNVLCVHVCVYIKLF